VQATATAPSNIALVKYWGKRDERLILPTNSSFSLSQGPLLSTTTTVSAASPGCSTSLSINGQDFPVSARIRAVLAAFSSIVGHSVHVDIVSSNTFPTAAGLASSASGLAALVLALDRLLGTRLSPERLSRIARLGSGSACRSVFPGAVLWRAGSSDETSGAEQLFPASHWPQLRLVTVVLSADRKAVGSSAGMQLSLRCGALSGRAARADARIVRITDAFRRRDVHMLAKVTIEETLDLQSVWAMTEPPLAYLTEASYAVMRLLDRLNGSIDPDRFSLGYTFDAGPSPVVVCEARTLPRLLETLAAACALGRVVTDDASVDADALLAASHRHCSGTERPLSPRPAVETLIVSSVGVEAG
jgi:diphosphomevalonate decarboxylase